MARSCERNIEKITKAGVAVREARYNANMTLQQLAEAIKIKPDQISEIKHGKRSIGKEIAHELTEVLNFNYKVFL